MVFSLHTLPTLCNHQHTIVFPFLLSGVCLLSWRNDSGHSRFKATAERLCVLVDAIERARAVMARPRHMLPSNRPAHVSSIAAIHERVTRLRREEGIAKCVPIASKEFGVSATKDSAADSPRTR